MRDADFAKALGDLEHNGEFIREYWKDLRTNYAASEAALTRTTFFIVVLAVVFVLIGTADIAEVTFAGLKLTNLDIIRIAIPVIVAYLSFVASLHAIFLFQLIRLHDRLAAHFWPNFYAADLEVTLRPSGSIGSTALVALFSSNKLVKTAAFWTGILRFVVYILGPLAFELFAGWQLLTSPAGRQPFTYIAIVLSIAFLLASVPNLIYIGQHLAEE